MANAQKNPLMVVVAVQESPSGDIYRPIIKEHWLHTYIAILSKFIANCGCMADLLLIIANLLQLMGDPQWKPAPSCSE